MGVYIVGLTAPNGNRVSRPIVATCACHAVAEMRSDHDIADDDPSFKVDVTERNDPDGQYEQLLKDAEARRYHAEMWSRWDRR